MDTGAAAILVPAATGLLGALIGGFLALIGTERAMRGTLLTVRRDRQIAHVALLRAVNKELELNKRILHETRNLNVWPPLRSDMLDIALSGDDRALPDPFFDAVSVIVRYNALAEVARELIQSSLPVPEALQSHLGDLAQEAATALVTASQSLDISVDDRENAPPGTGGTQQGRWLQRAWAKLTTPKLSWLFPDRSKWGR